MAELSVKIGAEIKDLLNKLKIAEKELKQLSIEAEKAGKSVEEFLKTPEGAKFQKSIDDASKAVKNLEKSTNDLEGGIGDIEGAVSNFKQGVGGIVDQFKAVKTAATAGGAAMKSALIATGIGALLVALQLIVENWDSISVAIGLADNELENLIDSQNRQIDYLDGALEILKEQEKTLELQGESTVENRKEQEKLLKTLQLTNIERIESLKTAIKEALVAATQLGIVQKILNAATGGVGKVALASKIDKDELKNLDDLNKQYQEAEVRAAKFNQALIEINKPKPVKKTDQDKLDKKIAAQKIKLSNDVFKAEQEDLKNIEDDWISFANNLKNFTPDTGLDSDLNLEIELGFKNIQAIEARVKDLKKIAEKLDVEVNLTGLNENQLKGVGQELQKIQEIQSLLKNSNIEINLKVVGDGGAKLTELQNELQKATLTADVLSGAIGSSFSGMASDISGALSTGIGAVDGFVGAIIQSLGQLLAELVASAITQAIVGNALASVSGVAASAQGVQIATQAALALGPAGVFALPGLLAATQAQITGALAIAKVPKFALGGFSGDDNLAFLNKNELILRPQEQAALYNAIRGKNLGSLANNTSANSLTDGIVGEVVLRGNNQVIQLKRAEKKMNRYYNS